MSNKIYYLFSSITFLQFYIPLVIEANKRNYKNIFIIRSNYKDYANPKSEKNFEILEKYLIKYNIKIKLSEETNFSKIKGIVFMIDGDIYGPPRREALNESLLFKLDRQNVTTFSMTEHMNFWTVYHFFIDKVNFCSFSNEKLVEQINLLEMGKVDLGGVIIDSSKSYKSDKNLFLGNTKLDNIPPKEFVYSKYKLNKDDKYCLFLFPKIRKNFQKKEVINIYKHLENLGFKIIVKSRPKDPIVEDELKGDLFVCSDVHPNESLELMTISELCIISSSSASEETLFCQIPCIDLESDFRWDRNTYLFDEKTNVKIENNIWRTINFDDFKKIYKKLEVKDSEYFVNLKEKFLYTHKNTSEKIFDFLNL